ncbi:kinase-like domain-containing protein [Hysterangium stoloniferum]|nr:kinase-like domain-containing protein [Hysterangium stoloniferum]
MATVGSHFQRAPSPFNATYSGMSNYRTDSSRPIDTRKVAKTHFHEIQAYLGKHGNACPFTYFPLTITSRTFELEGKLRRQLATLPKPRFKDLAGDVYFELNRRFPEFKEPEPTGTPRPVPSLYEDLSSPEYYDARTSQPSEDHSPLHVNPSPLQESFSRTSPLCLDGLITQCSQYIQACGGYADIWTGELDGRKIAIKSMRGFNGMGLRIVKEKLFKRTWREYLVWSSMSHPNILKCFGYSYDFGPESQHELPALISPWMSNGTVMSYIKCWPAVDRLPLIFGIANGLAFLHDRNPSIIHGDVRAGNILVSDQGIPCLTDFGLFRILGDTVGLTTSLNVAGSLRWMSPELFHGEKVDEQSDVWAFGMTVITNSKVSQEILTQQWPYAEISPCPVVMFKIMKGELPHRPDRSTAPGLTEELWSVCRQCWDSKPKKRPAMRDIRRLLKLHHNVDPGKKAFGASRQTDSTLEPVSPLPARHPGIVPPSGYQDDNIDPGKKAFGASRQTDSILELVLPLPTRPPWIVPPSRYQDDNVGPGKKAFGAFRQTHSISGLILPLSAWLSGIVPPSGYQDYNFDPGREAFGAVRQTDPTLQPILPPSWKSPLRIDPSFGYQDDNSDTKRKFQCSGCLEHFDRKSGLNAHAIVHTGRAVLLASSSDLNDVINVYLSSNRL